MSAPSPVESAVPGTQGQSSRGESGSVVGGGPHSEAYIMPSHYWNLHLWFWPAKCLRKKSFQHRFVSQADSVVFTFKGVLCFLCKMVIFYFGWLGFHCFNVAVLCQINLIFLSFGLSFSFLVHLCCAFETKIRVPWFMPYILDLAAWFQQDK